MESFGDRLKKIRLRLNYSQNEMADFFQISQRAICHYEKNQRDPSYDIIKKIMQKGFNIHWLLTGDGDMENGKYMPIQIEKKKIPQFPIIRNLLLKKCVNPENIAQEWKNISLGSLEAFLIHFFIDDCIKIFFDLESYNGVYYIKPIFQDIANNKSKLNRSSIKDDTNEMVTVSRFSKVELSKYTSENILECIELLNKEKKKKWFDLFKLNEKLLFPIFDYLIDEWQYNFETTTLRVWYSYKLNSIRLVSQTFISAISSSVHQREKDWLNKFAYRIFKMSSKPNFETELYHEMNSVVNSYFGLNIKNK